MINGIHAIVYSKDAEKLRAFFRDVLEWPATDAGRGWLIFALPPAEIAVHPGEKGAHELYLMCDDIAAASEELRRRGVGVSDVVDRGWGLLVEIDLPDGSKMGMYEPRHPTAI